MKQWLLGGALLFLLAAVAPASAENEEVEKLTAPEVKDLLEGGRATAVHVLSRIEYEMQHIPGSINIPINEMETSEKLPQKKDAPLIFYCMGFK